MSNFPLGIFLLQIVKELQVTKAKAKGIAPDVNGKFMSRTLQISIIIRAQK